MKFSAPCPVVKQKHDAGNTVFNSYLKIRSNDDRDFIPKMTFLRTFEIFCECGMYGKMPKSQNLELNRKQKSAAIRAWRMKLPQYWFNKILMLLPPLAEVTP